MYIEYSIHRRYTDWDVPPITNGNHQDYHIFLAGIYRCLGFRVYHQQIHTWWTTQCFKRKTSTSWTFWSPGATFVGYVHSHQLQEESPEKKPLEIQGITTSESLCVYSLRIQICPKKGITPIFLFWGWDWDHQSYSREGSGFLGIVGLTPM